MNRIARLLKHRWFDDVDARRAFGREGLAQIETRVAHSERHHSGEIRVCIEAGLPLSYLWRDASARDRAIAMFAKLRVWDTQDNNGVLIYLLLAERRIEIVADRGLNDRVPAEQWAAVTQGMADAFRAGRFAEGVNAAIDAVDRLLRAHFPLAPGAVTPNELPDAPVVG
jgi:uncharacterized membrane protein